MPAFSRLISRRTLTASAGLGLVVVAAGLYSSASPSVYSDDSVPFQVPAPHLAPPTRKDQISKLADTKFDILIIGAGATGAGIALDAATRGLKVALVERDDFACGTSSRSTKLVHGGVRYLEKAFWNLDYDQYKLVKEALAERATFLKIAPHLSFPLPIMIPIYQWWQVPYFWAGTKMYDLIAGKENMASSYFMGRSRTVDAFPLVRSENLKGALVYYDGSHNDSRMNAAVALTAVEQGAVVVNHLEVTELTKAADGAVTGAIAKDTLGSAGTVSISATAVVNATGPFSDGIRKLDSPQASDIVLPASGVHVVLPSYLCPSDIGMIDPQTSDGRVCFFLPWQGSTLAGTTDAPAAIAKDPMPTEEEIGWILREIHHHLSPEVQVRREDVLAAWSGLRPLVRDPRAKDTQNVVRNHLVSVSDSGLVTVAGGKWTTYREMAEDAVTTCVAQFGLKPTGPCVTRTIPVVGAAGYRPLLYMHLAQLYDLPADIAKHLASNYGDRSFDLLSLASRSRPTRLAAEYPFIDTEVVYAVRHEYALTAVDVLARRTRLAFLNAAAAQAALPKVIDIMGSELSWSHERKNEEWQASVAYLRSMGLTADKAALSRKEVEKLAPAL
ncbi:FAD dependent oxidoreductase-domain-containing protein [Lipomyces oligophaga]|uniref:FAD dependent oxidoreductase-domain-containing protein n=1 Tax=Lipomyces oligophaga TaxID=45792 RepID=UPI0034CF2CDF